MYDPLVIANYFIRKSFQLGTFVNVYKLMYLVFIANGIHLSKTGNRLIRSTPTANSEGPIINEIYGKLKPYYNNQITSMIDIDRDYCVSEDEYIPREQEIIKILDAVWAVYGNIDEKMLRSHLNKKGTPNRVVYDKFGNGTHINQKDIKEYYDKMCDTAAISQDIAYK